MKFYGKNKRSINNDFSNALTLNEVHSVEFRWRYQKNPDNGWKISQSRNVTDVNFCCVRAALRIRRRAQRLFRNKMETLATFKNDKGLVCQITNEHISTCLQASAKRVYRMSSKEELNKFISHSIRVGACVLLSEEGHHHDFIKLRLIWISEAFLDYLRNTQRLEDLHASESAPELII